MPITEIADQYLDAFTEGVDIEGGLSFHQNIIASNLDGSVNSLSRIDVLLDEIRNQHRPQPEAFIANQANVNFMYLLAFYVGRVVANASKAEIQWYQYDELLSLDPRIKDFFPRCFGSSISCVLTKKTSESRIFIPLNAIESRLFENASDKSVAYSAGAFI